MGSLWWGESSLGPLRVAGGTKRTKASTKASTFSTYQPFMPLRGALNGGGGGGAGLVDPELVGQRQHAGRAAVVAKLEAARLLGLDRQKDAGGE